jgi:4-amino-4-deoxy-L-arabinose transferase-like glycosyltransferase
VLAAIVAVGLALRVYFLIRWRPALVGFPDSTTYMQIAHTGIFDNPFRAGGYGEFLRLMHLIRPYLRFAIGVQHLLGIASGLLLYATVRRAGGPRWLGLVPAAVVMLGGSEIFLEHAPLSEALFIFLVDLALYGIVRSWYGSPAWALLAGLALGVATDVRAIGQAVVVVIAIATLLAPGHWRRRLLTAVLLVASATVPVLYYTHENKVTTGHSGLTSTGYFDLYARVAPFAQCSKFHPPKELRRLCIATPVSQRPGHDEWEYTALSPAFRVFGDPDLYVEPGENAQLRRFALDAILGQPLRYAEYVGRDLVRIVDPSFSSSPYPRIGNAGYGNTPESLLDYYFLPSTSAGAAVVIDEYYPGDVTVHDSIGFLLTYEKDTRLEGPAMALLLLLGLLAPFVTRADQRRAATLFLAAALVLLVAPILTSEYDYRFTVPAFGALAAAAAYGAWGCWVIAARRARARRPRT